MGVVIKRILRSRLPERFAGRLPPLLVEIGVGVFLSLLLVLGRIGLVPWTQDAAAFALVFVSVIAATVLAGWRSGLVALVIGQVLVWFLVVHPEWSWGASDVSQLGGLVLATLSQLVALVIVTLYQREVERAWSKRESQMDLLHKALAEIDHRTSNNYQTVVALVLAQAKSARNAEVKEALQQVADRIRAIASASRKLAIASESLQDVRIAEHLHDLCGEIERGLSRSQVSVECKLEDIVLGAEQTICLSIIVNELVTNALKHAFPDDRAGTIRVALARAGDKLELCVEDDGVGITGAGHSRGTGLGTRLVAMFVKQLGGRHELTSKGQGTRHRIRFPGNADRQAERRLASSTPQMALASAATS